MISINEAPSAGKQIERSGIAGLRSEQMRTNLIRRSLIAAVAMCWLSYLLWISRYSVLDDAFIHLRYADNLLVHHRISFDGAHVNYGTSSLLYVGLLALMRSILKSPLLPKDLSTVVYLGLLGMMTHRAGRLRQSAAYPWAVSLLFCLMSPFAIRWLSDGMETGLVSLAACGLALAISDDTPAVWLLFYGLLLTLLRVDLGLLVAFGALLLLSRNRVRGAIALSLGSALGMLAIRMAMGHLVPDTALAKRGVPPLDVFLECAYVDVASYSFGVGLTVVWIATAVCAWKIAWKSIVIANLALPILLMAATIQGQQLQGIRYIVWALLFSITWNLCILSETAYLPSRWWTVIPILFTLAWAVELPVASRIFKGRAHTLKAFDIANLEVLRNTTIVTADVGMIGYFSKAHICDLGGLVNGRDWAQMGFERRMGACMDQKPDVLFLSDAQFGYFVFRYGKKAADEWLSCGNVVFTNAGSLDQHQFKVNKKSFADGCPANLSN